jgi:hypothetical protein
MRIMRIRSLLAMSVAALAVTACNKKGDTADSSSTHPPATAPVPTPPPAATAISIFTGRRIGDNKQISDSTSMFRVRDTMYVVVTTNNTPSGGNLMARWRYETGQVIDSIIQQVDKTDSAHPTTVTEFHIAKVKPWLAGKYTVDITLDGHNIGTKDVEVVMKK